MKKLIALTLACVCVLSTQAQYKNDNVLFKTVYAEDLCKELAANPGYLLLDVRTPGEYADTSRFAGLNIGRMKNAMNIDNDSVAGRLSEIIGYKNKPVFVYCSHSQRSRRVSKTLADSGFTKVFNINGGMTTLHLVGDDISFCKGLYNSDLKYKLLTPAQLCQAVSAGGSTLIDIRSDSGYNGTTTDAKALARGKIKGAKNMPFANLVRTIDKSLQGSPIILIDDGGTESAKAAVMLMRKGFKDVSILFNGLDQWNNTNKAELPCRESLWEKTVAYEMITVDDFDKMAKSNKKLKILDIRTAEEFSNTYKDSWRNGGKIKNAISAPFAQLDSNFAAISKYKNDPVVVYGFSSSPEAFGSAKLLAEKGFKNVYVLLGGLFSIRWRAANIKGKSGLREWVVDVPKENE